MSRSLAAHHVVDFASVTDGWNIINVLAEPAGKVVILALKQASDYRQIHKGGGSSAKLFVDKPNNFRVYCQKEDSWEFVEIAETRQNLHFAQPLSQGRWLLVRARSNGNADGNGHLYSSEGNLLTTVPMGDGIQDVQTTTNGHIWVSYFDEGIFGGTKLGMSGLAQIDAEGVQQFDFNAAHDGMIADCYALNVVDDNEAWLCPYTDFPLIRLKNNQVNHVWDNNPVHGADAFAIWKDRALFTGGYQQKGKLFIVYLYRQEGKELVQEECQTISANGKVINFIHAFGRGSCLYLRTTDSLYSLDLQEV